MSILYFFFYFQVGTDFGRCRYADWTTYSSLTEELVAVKL